MAHIPYGYIINNGIAIIDEEAAVQVKELFCAYLAGLSLTDAAKSAGINRCHASIANILSCRRYMGDSFYPTIIDKDTYIKAEAEREKRAGMLGRYNKTTNPVKGYVKENYTAPHPMRIYDDPFAQAEYAYSLIESKG